MRRQVVARTPDVTVIIPGNLRYWVAEALIEIVRARELAERESAARKRRSSRWVPASIADEIRALYDQVVP